VKPKARHIPRQPNGPCPSELEQIADTFRHPLIARCGVTCTEDGEWALYLGVAVETKLPIENVENLGFPTVYVVEPDEPIRIQDNDQEADEEKKPEGDDPNSRGC